MGTICTTWLGTVRASPRRRSDLGPDPGWRLHPLPHRFSINTSTSIPIRLPRQCRVRVRAKAKGDRRYLDLHHSAAPGPQERTISTSCMLPGEVLVRSVYMGTGMAQEAF